MPKQRIDSIHFQGNDGEQTKPAQLYVDEFSQGEALKNALLRLGLFWLLSLLSIPIMIAHWVLVPGFFIAGPVVAVMVYRKRERMVRAEGTCPSCEESITLILEANDSLPKWTYCPACNKPLQLAR